jgi:tRNA(fMet)-specific endonuclease VapC
MRFLLDTNVLSDFVRGDANVCKRFKATRPDELAVSTVTVMEVDYGLALQPARARRIGPLLDAILDAIRVLPFSRADARSAGTVRAALRKRGEPIGPYDVLLAGCALARGLTLVTANEVEMGRVDGLVSENWRVD